MSCALPLFDSPAEPSGTGRRVEFTAEQEAAAAKKYALVQEWRSLCTAIERAGGRKDDATAEFLARNSGVAGLSRTRLYEWDKALKEDANRPIAERQGFRVLIDRRTLRGREPQAGKRCDDPAWRFFKSIYNAMPPQTVVTCYHVTAMEAKKQGWTWPSLRTVQQRVADPVFQIYSTFFRLGEREWMRKYGHKIPRRLQDYRAGEWLMSDFHIADQFCRRSEADPRIVRPKISASMDVRSRKVALHVCLNENQREVLAGLAKWVRANGSPMHWTIDNGKPYRAAGVSGGRPTSKRIEDEAYVTSVAGQLGIAVHFSIAFNPDGKTYVERLFSTLEQAVRFPGWCGHDQDDVHRAAHKLATEHPEQVPTVAEYAAAVEKWVAVYHQTPHRGAEMEGLSPNEAFRRFDPIPLAVAPEGVLDRLLMLTARAKVGPMGVLYRGVRYSNYEGLFRHMGQEVLLRVPEVEAGRVLVCDRTTGQIICEAVNARLELSCTTHNHVSEGMQKKARAKRLMKQIRESNSQTALLGDVAENAIAARAEDLRRNGEQAVATGTDGPVRNLRPLKTNIMERLARAVEAPPEPVLDFPELCGPDLASDDVDPELSLADLEDLGHAG